MKVACLGMGWWSDVLADAIKRSGKLTIAACYTRSPTSATAVRRQIRLPRLRRRYEEMLDDREHRGDHQHHAERRAPGDHARRGRGGQARLPRQADRQHHRRRARASPRPAARRGWFWRSAINAAAKATSAGSGADRRRRVRQAGQRRGQHQPRPPGPDRPDLVALHRRGHAGRRDAADRHPLHRRARISARAGQGGERALRARSCCPATIPDVASLVLEHENGALSTLNASYASASEYYLMNIYGKEATAYYDLHQGLRVLKRGDEERRAGCLREERHHRRGARGIRARRARRRRSPRWTASGAPRRSP